jgi:hypothetical protein
VLARWWKPARVGHCRQERGCQGGSLAPGPAEGGGGDRRGGFCGLSKANVCRARQIRARPDLAEVLAGLPVVIPGRGAVRAARPASSTLLFSWATSAGAADPGLCGRI